MPQFEIYVPTERVVGVAKVSGRVRTVRTRFVLGTLSAASALHAVNLVWSSGVRQYASRLNADGQPLARSPLKKKMLRAREITPGPNEARGMVVER